MVLPEIPVAIMAVVAAITAIVPLILLFFFKKRGADVLPFFVGCAVFVLFALMIEAVINYAIGRSSFGKRMTESIPLLAVYGGLMAGVFEESGRFIAFKTVLKSRNGKDVNALQYGAGHGGIEAILTVSLSYLGYILLSSYSKSGALEGMMPKDELELLIPIFKMLADAPVWTFALALIERLLAIAVHVSLSVLVWFAAKNSKKLWYYPFAILLHAVLDCVVVLCSKQFMLTDAAVEAVNAAITAGIALIAVKVWKTNNAAARE